MPLPGSSGFALTMPPSAEVAVNFRKSVFTYSTPYHLGGKWFWRLLVVGIGIGARYGSHTTEYNRRFRLHGPDFDGNRKVTAKRYPRSSGPPVGLSAQYLTPPWSETFCPPIEVNFATIALIGIAQLPPSQS